MASESEVYTDASPDKETLDNEEGSDSEESSTSFHSLTEQLQTTNIEDIEFSKAEKLNIRDEGACAGDKDDEGACAGDKDDDSVNSADKNMFDIECDNHDLPKDRLDKYFIDDEYLQTVDLNSSDEDKAHRHQTAIEKKNEANEKFKQEQFEEAALLYTEGLRQCPLPYDKDRSILYANRAAARSKSDSEEERKGAVADCSKAIELDPNYFKAIVRRANLHMKLENLESALKDYQRILEMDPRNAEAQHYVMTLPKQIEEKNEKLKEEMMGKLKDLGNMILKPFGLSTNNFELKQNPEGSYNISFNQKPS